MATKTIVVSNYELCDIVAKSLAFNGRMRIDKPITVSIYMHQGKVVVEAEQEVD